jgi:tryptophanyl-tRNA synthetase
MAIDQEPHFRLSRDIVEKLGHRKPAVIHSKFMTPLTGIHGKMSSSNSKTAIFMTDTPNEVKKKINKYAFKHWKIPVCYDDKFAIDLEEISLKKSVEKEAIISLHFKIYCPS